MTLGKEVDQPKFFTLEEITKAFPLTETIFPFKTEGKKGKEEGVVSAEVSINEEGTILYVVPRSAKLINCKQIEQLPVIKAE